jgi:hypothetical protein
VVLATNNSIGSTQSIAVRYPFAYMGQGNNLLTVDLSTLLLLHPPLDLTSNIRDIAVPATGDYAYIATDTGLKVINISIPSSPAFACPTIYPCTPCICAGSSDVTYGIAVSGTMAYLAQDSSGFKVVNVTDPLNPEELGSYDMSYAYDVASWGISPSYVYVANGVDGLFVMNVSTPATPVKSGFVKPAGSAIDIATTGNYGYIAYGAKGLRIVNVMTPTAPILKGSFESLGDAKAIDVYTFLPYQYAYVAAGNSGLWVFQFDEGSPANPPIAVGRYNATPVSAQDVAVAGNEIYIANGSEGLLILEFFP